MIKYLKQLFEPVKVGDKFFIGKNPFNEFVYEVIEIKSGYAKCKFSSIIRGGGHETFRTCLQLKLFYNKLDE